MPDRNYGFAVGRIRVLETRLLDRGRLERMADAADLHETLSQLGETEYAPLVASGLGPMEIAAAELARVRDLVVQLAPEADDLAFLLWRWDLLNLKVLLRGEDGKADLNDLGRYRREEMAGWFRDGHPELPVFFAEARAAGASAYAAEHDPQLLDAAVDRLYYHKGADRWRGRDTFLAGYWPARIDLLNLRTLVRAKHLDFDRRRLAALLLAGGTVPEERFAGALGQTWDEIAAWWAQGPYAGVLSACNSLADLAALERAGENLLLERAKPAKGIPLGLDPVLGYYLAKEHETRLVNLVLTAKTAGVPGARIKERLRGVYV
ncbi:MAG: V-type ATPase subunit [Bacteroidota bacterium]